MGDCQNYKQTKGYRHIDKNGILKDLVKPIPGKYSDTYDDPFSQEKPISEYYFSNEDGEIAFDQMYFSVYGRAD